jgi:hypothetical protein
LGLRIIRVDKMKRNLDGKRIHVGYQEGVPTFVSFSKIHVPP